MKPSQKIIQEALDGEYAPLGDADVVTIPDAPSFVPVTKRNICYIVGAVLLNDSDDVLLIQEAKSSCYGQWYLPMGRLEPGETLQEGAMREVLEESGLEFMPTTLVCVEFHLATWNRFTFTGNITGGSLKTVAEKDEESLQAKWFKYDDIKFGRVELRANDVLPLIEIGYRHRGVQAIKKHPDYLPLAQPHKHLFHKILIVCRSENNLHVLVSTSGCVHIPSCLISPHQQNLRISVSMLIKMAFTSEKDYDISIHGLLALEYCGKPARTNDGICYTYLSTLGGQEVPICRNNFEWCMITEDMLRSHLEQRLKSNMCIPLIEH